jgi:hypothetical protein
MQRQLSSVIKHPAPVANSQGNLQQLIPITTGYFVSPGGSGKAEGFADGEPANHGQADRLPLPPKAQ